MSEEVTYADLRFQGSNKTENTQEFDELKKKAAATPSHVWRHAVLPLGFLCLLLFIGMGVLGGMFYKTLKIEKEKFGKLQNINEELERNVSLQLMNNTSSSNELRNLSNTLQKIATKLCYELYRQKSEHKCKPCPTRWLWHEKSCYLLDQEERTWQDSKTACAAQNASLLKINNKSALDFIKPWKLYDYWLGLSPETENTKPHFKKLDDILNSSAWIIENINDLNNMYCGYMHGTYVYYRACGYKSKAICQKMANPVKIESTLTSDIPDERM
ncbi:C-type lectin domain family 12 member A isoform X2 [Otolemur garnettii]|uniref:C-type lectin domain family 12 member A isoform X2 n=1 Tax=Otolemur garnettii TaxID=30611 RepID=UPI0002742A28|nr:C-type lectin domain family 12 member A isoform X2 [Otolemur garnettii]